MEIKIEYDGEYPNLCSGNLTAIIDRKRWKFPEYSLFSGGSVYFDGDWNEQVEEGAWGINEWPDNFPEELKQAVTDAVNEHVPPGCCGGCI